MLRAAWGVAEERRPGLGDNAKADDARSNPGGM